MLILNCNLTPKYCIEVKDTIYMKILAIGYSRGDCPHIVLFLMELRRQMQLHFCVRMEKYYIGGKLWKHV